MRTNHFHGLRRLVLLACGYALVACNADGVISTPQQGVSTPITSVNVLLSGTTVEPAEDVRADINLLGAQNASVSSLGSAPVWTSSDSTIATVTHSVSGGASWATVTGRRPGTVTITAIVRGVSGSAVFHVAWRPDARLTIGGPRIGVRAGDHLTFASSVRRSVPVGDVVWTSSNTLVASVDAPGIVSAIATGSTAIVAHYLGLVDSVIVDVALAPVGFGYFYSGNANVTDTYEYTFWSGDAKKSFSSAGIVAATWEPPYASRPELGWIGPNSPAPDAVLHAVSLEDVPCTAYLQQATGHQFVTSGAPLIDCLDLGSFYYQSVKMEFVAFRPAEFSGTLSVVRPGMAFVSTNAGAISTTSPTHVAGDSLYWFVTPGAENLVACSLAPTDTVPIIARVTCVGRPPTTDPVFYAMGFGSDARHGSAPIGFAEVGNTGVVTRKAVGGLDITTIGVTAQSLDVVVSGAPMAAYDRIPAVLVTAIAPTAAACSITEPVRTSPTTVTFHTTCPAGVSGVMLGAMY